MNVEHVYYNEKYNATERSRALDVLAGCVELIAHPYLKNHWMSSGVCWCGYLESHKLHRIIKEER